MLTSLWCVNLRGAYTNTQSLPNLHCYHTQSWGLDEGSGKYLVLLNSPPQACSYMSANVLLNLLNELGKEIKCEACRAFYLFFAMSYINSIIQMHEC